MSFFKNNSLAVALVASAAFGLVAIQGCSSDEQNAPSGAGGSRAGSSSSGGKSSTGGSGGKPVSEGGAAGEDQPGAGGENGGGDSVAGAGGEGGGGPDIPCDLSFDNSTLTVYTDNGGKLPPLP